MPPDDAHRRPDGTDDATVAAAGKLSEALEVVEQALEDALARPVVHDQLADVVALGGRVLGVRADVEVEPGAVAQEDVAAAPPADDPTEQVPRHLVW